IKDLYTVDKNHPQHPKNPAPTNDLTAFLLNLFRFYQNTLASKTKNLYIDSSYDSSIRFNSMFRKAIVHNDPSRTSKTYFPTRVPGRYLQVTSSPLNYTFPSFFHQPKVYGLFFWTMLLAFLVIFYYVLHYIFKTMFAVSLPVFRDSVDPDPKRSPLIT